MNEHQGHRQRLRDAFLARGLEGMPDHQVLELLLTYALPRVDVNPLAHRLLDRFGSLKGVLTAGADQLQTLEGVGPSAAAFLNLLGQVDRRILLQTFTREKQPLLDNPQRLGGYMLALSLTDRYETLRLVCLNKNFRLTHVAVISRGSLTEVLADPRRILEVALHYNACFIALAHNHPSGDVTPSQEDRLTAARMEAAAESLGIGVADQMILGHAAMFSFRSEQVFAFSSPTVAQAMTLEEYNRIERRQTGNRLA